MNLSTCFTDQHFPSSHGRVCPAPFEARACSASRALPSQSRQASCDDFDRASRMLVSSPSRPLLQPQEFRGGRLGPASRPLPPISTMPAPGSPSSSVPDLRRAAHGTASPTELDKRTVQLRRGPIGRRKLEFITILRVSRTSRRTSREGGSNASSSAACVHAGADLPIEGALSAFTRSMNSCHANAKAASTPSCNAFISSAARR